MVLKKAADRKRSDAEDAQPPGHFLPKQIVDAKINPHRCKDSQHRKKALAEVQAEEHGFLIISQNKLTCR
jgi:hypothetical protein